MFGYTGQEISCSTGMHIAAVRPHMEHMRALQGYKLLAYAKLMTCVDNRPLMALAYPDEVGSWASCSSHQMLPSPYSARHLLVRDVATKVDCPKSLGVVVFESSDRAKEEVSDSALCAYLNQRPAKIICDTDIALRRRHSWVSTTKKDPYCNVKKCPECECRAKPPVGH